MSGRINPGGHGWTKDVAPPKPGSRPKGLPPKPKGVILMEASQQPGQGDQQGEGGAAQSQEQPTQDSNLQTPQPDQQVPSEAERQAAAEASGTEQAPNPGQAAQPVEQAPVERPDQVEEAAQRESDLEAQQREHNARSGGGEVREGEVAQQRQEHNERASTEGSQDQA